MRIRLLFLCLASTLITVATHGQQIVGLNTGLGSSGFIAGAYGYSLGAQYPADRVIGGEGHWNAGSAVSSTYTGENRLNLRQNSDGSVTYTFVQGSGGGWRGDEVAIYIREPISRYWVEAGHWEWYEGSDGCGGDYVWVTDLWEWYNTEGEANARRDQISGSYESVTVGGLTYEWRILHAKYWGTEAGWNATRSETLSFDPSWFGKQVEIRAWSFQRSSGGQNRVDFFNPGRGYTLDLNRAPTASIWSDSYRFYPGQSVGIHVRAQDPERNASWLNLDVLTPVNGFYGNSGNSVNALQPDNNGLFGIGATGDYTRDLSVHFPQAGTYVFRAAAGDPYAHQYSGEITVYVPARPTATITADTGTINFGQSTTIRANYASDAGRGDALSQTAINIVDGSEWTVNGYQSGSQTWVFTPSHAGTYTFKAYAQTTLAPSWNVYATTQVVVNKGTQSVSLTNPGTRTFGDPPFDLSASASSGLAVALSASGPATVSGKTLTITGAGSVTVTARQGGDANWNAAEAAQTFTVEKTSQTALAVSGSGNQTYNASQTLSTSGGSGAGAVSYAIAGQSSSGVATLSGATLIAVSGTGWVEIQATKAADANYNSASSALFKVTMAKASQATLTLNANPNQTYNTSQTLTTSGGSGSGAVTFSIVNQSSAGAATLVGSTLTAGTGSGWVDVQATKAADSNYNQATSGVVRVTFAKSNQASLGLSPSSPQTHNTSQTLATTGGAGGGAVSYAIVGQSAAGVATLSGATLTANTGTGWVDVQATKASDTNYNAATSSPARVALAKAGQATLTLVASTTQPYNTSQGLSTTGGSGVGAVTYAIVGQSATGVATLSGTTLTANTGTGWVDLQATKATDSNYTVATSGVVRVTFTKVAQGALTLSASTSQAYGTTQTLSASGGSGSGAVTYTIVTPSTAGVATLSGAILTANAGAGWVDVRATKATDSNYNAADSSIIRVTFTKANQGTLTAVANTTQTYGTSQSLSTSGGSGSGAVTYSISGYSAAGVATLSGNSLTSTAGTGYVDVLATKASDANYNAATATFRVNMVKATQAALTLNAATPQTYGAAQTLSTSGGSGTGSASYAIVASSAANVASLSGATLTANSGTGWVDLQATKAGDGNYNPATATKRVDLAKANQATLTLSAATTQVYNTSQTLSSTGGSGTGVVTYAIVNQSAAGVASLAGATLTANAGAGWVEVRATKATDANYDAVSSSTVRVNLSPKPVTFTFSDTSYVYDGAVKAPTIENPSGATYSVSGTTSATDAGSYNVTVTATGNYSGSSTCNWVIDRKPVTFSFAPVTFVYNGEPQGPTVYPVGIPYEMEPGGVMISNPEGTTSSSRYGNFYFKINATGNYEGWGECPWTIACCIATVNLADLNHTYDGTAKSATATTADPSGLNVVLTYDGKSPSPTLAGSYQVKATVQAPVDQYGQQWGGDAEGTLVIAKATQASLTLNANASQVNGTSQTLSTTGGSGNGAVTYEIIGQSADGVATLSECTLTATAGTGSVTIKATKATGTDGKDGTEGNYLPISSEVTVTFTKATATITLNNLNQAYNGTPRSVTATTSPSGLPVTITYNGSTTPPSAPGSYAITAAVNENPNYQGSKTGTLVIDIPIPATGALAGGGSHAVALKSDGTVWAWGTNTVGQLGDGTTVQRLTAVQVGGLTGVVTVAAGASHSVVVKADGTVWAWGANTSGQLGDGTTVQRLTPVQVGGLDGIVAIATGASHSVAVKSDGTVWAWGANTNGQLGDGTTVQRLNAVRVGGLSGVVTVAAGASHSVAVKGDGTVWAWGANTNGQLGDGTTVQRLAPVQVNGLSAIAAIAAGGSHSLALKNDGTVWAWGANLSGQLGDGTTTSRTTAAQVDGLSGAVAIAAGDSHSVAVKSDGTVWAWGANNYGQLGDGTTMQRITAVQIGGVSGQALVAAGKNYTTALSNGIVLAWGNNDNGQLGDGTTTQRTTPLQVSGLISLAGVAAGNDHAIALKNDGTLWSWGANTNGQLGDGSTTGRMCPAQVNGLGNVTAVAPGYKSTIALRNDGTVWAWGRNTYGQLGDGSTTQRLTPVQVSGLSSVVTVAAGGIETGSIVKTVRGYSAALRSDGTVWTWGDNSSGQLGDGTVTQRLTPVQVGGLVNVMAIAAGGRHMAALRSNGTVWTWGYNYSGQLGDGTTTDRPMPVQVGGLTNVVAIATGVSHTAALKSDGTVWTWGYNIYGQLGDGATTQRTTPLQVAGLTDVVALTAGAYHTLALKSDGTAWAWGSNASGQLGDGTTANRTTPVQVRGIRDVLAVTAGGSFTIALGSDTTLRGWGGNGGGQLGFSSFRTTQAAIRLIVSGDDVDQDGMLDGWEIQYFGNLSHSGGDDLDGDGLTDIQEFFKDSDPTEPDVDEDLLTDFVDLFPDDYYNGVVWSAPAPIAYGAALGISQLNATAQIPGTFTYSPAAGTVLDAGTHTLSVTFTPNDLSQYVTVTRTVPLVVNKAAATVTLGNLSQSYTGSPRAASATTVPAGLTVNYSYFDSFGASVTPTAAGSYTVVGTINDTNYQGSGGGTLVISAANQAALTLSASTTQTYNTSQTLSSAGGSGAGGVEYRILEMSDVGVATLNGAVLTANTGTGWVKVSATKAADANYAAATSSAVIVNFTKAPATVTLGNLGHTYSGATKAATATTSPTGLPVTFTYNGSASAPKNAGSYTVVGTINSPNYTGNASGTLVIQKVPLTVTANNASRLYGAANPAFSASYSGFVNGETSSVITGVPAFSTSATTTSTVGTYPITPSVGTLTAANYTFANFVSGTLTVNKAPLKVTANNASKTYGAANPTFSVTYSGFVNGETSTVVSGAPSFATTATASSPVGTYPITPAVGTLTATNYTFTPFVAGTLTVNKAALKVTANNAARLYGAADPAFSATYSGFVNGDTAAVITGAPAFTTNATRASAVGSSYVITPAVGTLAATNYSFTPFVNGSLTINRAPLTITANNASRARGLANPAFTASFNGFQNGDTAAVVTGLTFTTTATVSSAAGTYPITPSGASAANYSVTHVAGALTITEPLPDPDQNGADWDHGIEAQTRYGIGPDGVPLLNPNARTGIFYRGRGDNPRYHTTVVPLEFQNGIPLDDLGDNAAKFGGVPASELPWFVRTRTNLFQHIVVEGGNVYYDRLNYENPVVAFGSQGGGSPLLVNRHYRFGLAAGEVMPNGTWNLVIDTYRKADFQGGGTDVSAFNRVLAYIPHPSDAAWDQFARNGYMMSVAVPGMETTIRFVEDQSAEPWGWSDTTTPPDTSPFILDHKATSDEYCYRISFLGRTVIGNKAYAISQFEIPPDVYSTNGLAYTLDFDQPGSWQSTFVHQPHFESEPAPSDYMAGEQALSASPAAVPTVADSGFERPTLPYGQFARPTDGTSAWSFSPYLSYLSTNGSGHTALNPGAPEGAQVAVLQRDGWISQSVTFSAGTYVVSCKAARREYGSGPKSMSIAIDGNVVDTVALESADYREFVTRTFTVEAGLHTLTFAGVNPDSDLSVLLDVVRIEPFVPISSSGSALDPLAYRQVDHSPELRRHPVLDKLVEDLNADPLALANYVINEIELTDALSYNENGDVSEKSVNQGGVSRGALATYMEGQGSPWEQCALLVYLLRQAGVPAVYVEPEHNRLQMLDTDLSKLLRVQLSGAVDNKGALYGKVGDRLIAVNYPWVAAYIEDEQRWVHVFPWLKDTEVTEGYELYDFMPAGYDSGRRWVDKYLRLDPAIHSLDDEDDTVASLFPKFISKALADSRPDLSVEDLGVSYLNRRQNFSRWQDYRPAVCVGGRLARTVEKLESKPSIFNTIEIAVSSQSDAAKKIQTGTLRILDLHNRQLVIQHTQTGANTHSLELLLAPFRPDASGEGNFAAGSDLLAAQRLTLALGAADDLINVEVGHHRHLSFPRSDVALFGYWQRYLGQTYTLDVSDKRQIRKGDLAALCLSTGRVTDQMLDVHVQDHWEIERLRETDPALVDATRANRTLVYLMGMNYYRNTSRFRELNARLHKRHVLSEYAVGLSKFIASRVNGGLPNNGEIRLGQASVDMFFNENGVVSNGTIHANSNLPFGQHVLDYLPISTTAGSADEHNIIRVFFDDDYAISTVKLLRLAQENGNPGMVWVTKANYAAEFAKEYTVGGVTKPLSQWSSSIWTAVDNAFKKSNSNFVYAYVTPGPMVTPGNAYKGMGALIYSQFSNSALIDSNTGGINGGYGGKPIVQLISGYGTVYRDANGNIVLVVLEPVVVKSGAVRNIVPPNAKPQDVITYIDKLDNNKAYVLTKVQLQLLELRRKRNPNLTLAEALRQSADKGDLSEASFLKRTGDMIADPVNSTTGAFYHNELDLRLNGPMPLEIRRNYSSHQLASNEFGYGWLFNYVPYLVVYSGPAGEPDAIIHAADSEGSVVAYVRQGTDDVWLPASSENPDASNLAGGLTNIYQSKITRTTSGTDTVYQLGAADGSVRTYRVRQFPVAGLNRERPYLEKWTDSRGNYHAFVYGTDPSANDYGKISRIRSSNGNAVNFKYDVFGHITAVSTADGRIVTYVYNASGDLADVKMPDGNRIKYEYGVDQTSVPVFDEAAYLALHADVAAAVAAGGFTSGQQHYELHGYDEGRDPGGRTTVPTSNHLIVRELKPGGRILENTYDDQRRVTQQKATVGSDLKPVVNANFDYSEVGKTKIKDAYGRETVYEYQSGLVRKITDPLLQTIEKQWYETTDAATGAYQRSVKSIKDKRGLLTEFKYDSRGNIRETKVTGDLDGDAATVEAAVSTSTYNARNQPESVTDAAGVTTEFFYEDAGYPYLTTRIVTKKSSTVLREDRLEYTEKSDSSGCLSRGLLTRKYAAFGTSDQSLTDFEYSPSGFLIQEISHTGTADPAVVTTFAYNLRGELVETRDADGRRTTFAYDAMGRLTVKEIRDERNSVIGTWKTYYNASGEVSWVDGPRSGPEDWVRRNYDGAGRIREELIWRSQAKADGSGVEAPVGDALTARTSYEHDLFGNLIRVTGPRGHATVMSYDEIGQLKTKKSYAGRDPATATPLRTESFEYEPGGNLREHTNPLGGVTKKFYTSAGQLRRQESPDGAVQEWRYYADGRLHKEILRNNSYWETTYDDVARIVTRTFKKSNGAVLASESTEADRRGNVVRRTDVEGNSSTTTYDDLNRVKTVTGPAGSASSAQQTATTYYGASAKTIRVKNGLDEETVTTTDALGRPVKVEVKDASATAVRVTTYSYSSDHHAVTVTQGSGANAIATTTYTDHAGRSVLMRHADGKFVLNRYDLGGNLLSTTDEYGQTTKHGYDALGQLKLQELPDGTVTTFSYDAAGNPTSRAMATGQLLSEATYDNAGRMTGSTLHTSSATTRQVSYTYYPTGHAFAGLLKDMTDPRGVVHTTTYDDFIRPYTVTSDGLAPEMDVTTTRIYDKRGLLKSLTQSSPNSAAGPPTLVTRDYDAYGQLVSEKTSINGAVLSHLTQTWDATGRRDSLRRGAEVAAIGSGAGALWTFGYRADGALTRVNPPGQPFAFGYLDNGLLSSRNGAGWASTVTARDTRGRITDATITAGSATPLTESLTWRADSKITTYSAQRQGSGTWNESRSYTYNNRDQLTSESYAVAAGQSRTLTYQFDSNATGGLGVRTQATRDAGWSVTGNAVNGFGRTTEESTNAASRSVLTAGTAAGAAAVYLRFDGAKIPWVNLNTGNGVWNSVVDLSPRSYSMVAVATAPDGQTATTSPQSFNVVAEPVTLKTAYDANGNVTSRTYSDGKVQTMTWDGLGRLVKMTQRDAFNAGFDWVAVYDGLGRRLQTTYQSIRAGANSGAGLTTSSWFDPQVEFLEIAVAVAGERVWKIYGPDLNGGYGSFHGTGGLVATILESNGSTRGVISDHFGNGVASVSGGQVSWFSTRVGAYGALPESWAEPFTEPVRLAEATAWRGRRIDPTGLYWLGARYYDPLAGRFLSPDPLGHGASLSLYDFANGDPVNFFDPDGRVGKAFSQEALGLGGRIDDALVEFYYTGQDFFTAGLSLYMQGDIPPDLMFSSQVFNAADPTTVTYLGIDFDAGAVVSMAQAATFGLINAGSGAYDLATFDFQSAQDNFAAAFLGLTGARSVANAQAASGMKTGHFYLSEANSPAALAAAKQASQDAIRAQVLANIAESQAARAASSFERFAAETSRTNAQLIQEIANRAEKAVGGIGRFAGTEKHVYAKAMLDTYQKFFENRGLKAETTWLNGQERAYGTKDAVRIDVLDTPASLAYDYKFTVNPPGLSAAQAQRILSNGPAGLQGVVEVNPMP